MTGRIALAALRGRRSRWLAVGALVALGAAGALLDVSRGDGTRAGASAEREPLARNVARIAYSEADDLWVVDADGRGRRRLTETAEWVEFDPSLSPDRRQIAYRREPRTEGPSTAGSEIWVIDIVSGRQRRISPKEGGESPAWSPDGTQIAFSNRAGLHLVSPDGGNVKALEVAGSCPTWSPNGTRIAYCGAGPAGGTSLEIVHADGSNNVVLVGDRYENFIGAWSPDGMRLALSSNRGGDLDVYTIGRSGRGLRHLVGGRGAQAVNAWLPDGRLIFADSPPDEATSHWKSVRADGSDVERVIFLEGAADPLDWGPMRR